MIALTEYHDLIFFKKPQDIIGRPGFLSFEKFHVGRDLIGIFLFALRKTV